MAVSFKKKCFHEPIDRKRKNRTRDPTRGRVRLFGRTHSPVDGNVPESRRTHGHDVRTHRPIPRRSPSGTLGGFNRCPRPCGRVSGASGYCCFLVVAETAAVRANETDRRSLSVDIFVRNARESRRVRTVVRRPEMSKVQNGKVFGFVILLGDPSGRVNASDPCAPKRSAPAKTRTPLKVRLFDNNPEQQHRVLRNKPY